MPIPFLTAEWKNLIFSNYIVDPHILKQFLPAKTELDFFNDNTYVSLVGFQFYNTRIRGIKVLFHTNFLEANLRFYVKYKDGTQWKRGTVFISEIVPRSAITFIANSIYHENYRTMQMNYYLHYEENIIHAGYHWKYKKCWNKLEVVTNSKAIPIIGNSEEEFITEHYWGYSRQRDSVTFEYQVEHPRWMIFPVAEYKVNVDFPSLYGNEFSFLGESIPTSVIFAEGSKIAVYKKRKL